MEVEGSEASEAQEEDPGNAVRDFRKQSVESLAVRCSPADQATIVQASAMTERYCTTWRGGAT